MSSKESKDTISPFQITAGVWMVPCRIDKSKKLYIPSIRPFKNEKKTTKNYSRQVWSPEEDRTLTEIIGETGAKKWSVIASRLNISLHNGLPIRLGKQCRERWLGSISPDINKDNWTVEEDGVIITQQMINGNKWSAISEFLPGRTENQVKNRWRKLEKMAKKERKNLKLLQSNQTEDAMQNWMFFGW